MKQPGLIPLPRPHMSKLRDESLEAGIPPHVTRAGREEPSAMDTGPHAAIVATGASIAITHPVRLALQPRKSPFAFYAWAYC